MPKKTDTLDLDLTLGDWRRQFSGYKWGKRINAVSLEAEAWFWRLHSAADDFGNLIADQFVCHQLTSGRRAAQVTPEQVDTYLNSMHDVGLVKFYYVNDERFLHIPGFESMQKTRNGRKVRRYPASPHEQAADDVPDDGGETGGNRGKPGEGGAITPHQMRPDQITPDAGGDESPSAQKAKALSEARSFASCWITAEAPRLLKTSQLRAFEQLIVRVGKDRAVAEAKTWLGNSEITNPFAYALSLFDENGNPRKSNSSKKNGATVSRPAAAHRPRRDR